MSTPDHRPFSGDLPREGWSVDVEVRGEEDPVACLAGTRRKFVVR